jgi:tRNA A-37 threonylcarbamoyl transferase component Bud32
MSTPNEPTASHHDPLDAVIADYLDQVEAGAVPDREALLARHPDLADRLRAFLADYDRLDRQAAELHLAPDPGATADAVEPTGDLPRVRYFGDYELLEVVAHGGMGVVYKARQTSLNRLVALKMILHGRLATPRHVARFRAEAEAAANLDHPNIVPIYEVGEHQGQHYYAMRFIEGASLARHPRGDSRAEARLAATLARAVYYAHQRGILHRDLKPSNVLVQCTGPGPAVPFITDFGLAKRLGSAAELTATGEAPGTPRYMAPEQAAGRRDLTVAADVYGLGVVLYERLTGAPPFTSDDALELYRQIREAVPPRPSGVRPGLDRDLETVCLKCLEKEPARRYASAEALAEDLERWLRGEPIVARAVGPLGRLRRWGRRNPAVAALTTAVALVLLAGIATSLYFAVQADRRATAERAERERAQAAEAKMERAIVRGLVRPMNPDPMSPDGIDALGPMEMEALWDLAATVDPGLRPRLLAEMLGTEADATRLGNRLEWVVHSAVGLDQGRREQAERLLVERMRDPARSVRHRTAIAWAVLDLAEAGSESQRASVAVIGQGWADEKDQGFLIAWRESLLRRADGLAPADAAGLLTRALDRETAGARVPLAQALADAAGRLAPAEAAGLLTRALDRETDPGARVPLAKALAETAGRWGPEEAVRVLAPALEKETERNSCSFLARGLVEAAGRLRPARGALLLLEELDHVTNASDRCQLARGLASLAGRLAADDAARVCAAAVPILTRTLDREKDKDAVVLTDLARAVAALAGWLEPAEAARVRALLVRPLTRALDWVPESDYVVRRDLAGELGSVVGRLEPAEADRVFTETLAKHKDDAVIHGLAPALAAGRLGPAKAARVLSELLEKESNPWRRSTLARGLAAAAGRLGPAEAARVCAGAAHALTRALEKETAAWARAALAEGLASVAGRLEPAEAARVCSGAARALARSLEEETDAAARAALAGGLAALAGRLGPAEAADLCGGAARALARALEKETAAAARAALAEGLAALAAWMGPAEGARVAKGLARSLTPRLIPAPRINPFSRLQDADAKWEVIAVSALLAQQDGEGVEEAVRGLARLVASASVVAPEYDPNGMSDIAMASGADLLRGVLRDGRRAPVRRRADALAGAVGGAAGGPLAALPLLPLAAEPLPCCLSTQDLVDLLKLPTCVRDVRRVILDQLGSRYGRRFETHWDFVGYAQEQGLNLDFTTPPQRPDH